MTTVIEIHENADGTTDYQEVIDPAIADDDFYWEHALIPPWEDDPRDHYSDPDYEEMVVARAERYRPDWAE